MNVSKLLLTIDIGNNTIDNGIFMGSDVISRFRFEHSYIPKYTNFLNLSGKNIEIKALICSVVPYLTKNVILSLRKRHIQSLCLKELTYKPSMAGWYKGLGDDRKVATWSAIQSYKLPCVVIDLGSAITIDVINSDRTFKGGMIIPGVNMWVRSLAKDTALLPELRSGLAKQRGPLLGKNTQQCIRSGVDHGLVGMIDSILDKIAKSLGKRPQIILTGGDCMKVSRYLRHKHTVDDLLILRGLRELYDQSGGWNEKPKKSI